MTARVTQLSPVIYVGIDVGSDIHSITIANDSGELLKRTFSNKTSIKTQ